MRFASASAFAFVLIGAAAFACSDDDAAPPGGPGTGPGGADGGPIVKKEFPLATPSVGGYTLVDAYPGVVFDIPAAAAWPKGAKAPFVLERTGQIRTVEDGKRRDLLDFSDKVHVGGEGGAVGMVLHPQFGSGDANQYVYVWYNACNAPGCQNAYTQKLERYTWNKDDRTFDAGSAFVMIEQREFENVHNAGRMLFGSDGFLYFGNGDDARAANHQTITNGLFAGIFRIDVDMDAQKSHPPPSHTPNGDIDIFTRQGYFIPNDNPFVGKVENGLEEFWALGFRNPFSFSFDKKTGDLWMGDVGEVFREEVNKVVKGGNYEWPIKEGTLDYVGTKVKQLTVGTRTPPVYEYAHGEMGDLSAIFGGIVYRGGALTDLTGKYLYVDWISNRIWSLDLGQSPPVRTTLVDNQYKVQPLAIAEDNDGEFYVLEYGAEVDDPVDGGGRVRKLVKAPAAEPFPTRLVETYLFDDVPSLKPAANLVPYDVTSPLWSDGAEKQRWIRVPQGQKVTSNADGSLKFPVGTVFVKQFDLPPSVNIPGRSRHLETRVLIVGSETTYGYSFRWNKEGTDATLVSDAVDEKLTDTQTWQFPSFGQCWECHRNGFADLDNVKRNDSYRILGFTGAQLGDQRAALATKGALDSSVSTTKPAALPKPSDTSRSLEERAHAYLDANCAPCHHENGSFEGGGQTWRAEFGAGDLNARHLDQVAANVPMSIRLNLPGAQLVAPGDPEHSLLLARIKTNELDLRMPPLARQVTDVEGAKLIEEWIRSLK